MQWRQAAPVLVVIIAVLVLMAALQPSDEAGTLGVETAPGSGPSPTASTDPSTDPSTGPSSGSSASPGAVPSFDPGATAARPTSRPTTPRATRSPRATPGTTEPALPPVEVVPAPPTTFRVSTLNVLGAGHTDPGGNRPGYASGQVRMGWSLDLLARAGSSVVGFQELQPPQGAVLRARRPGWGIFPGGRQRQTLRNSVAWDGQVWEFVGGRTLGIPYFGGTPLPMPYVLLRHRTTGQEVWFTNFHNPADARGPAARFRRIAIDREAALVSFLHATGSPVILTGDLNDRAEAFCPLTAAAPLQAANGGSTGRACRPPARMPVDWIFGTTDVTFDGYTVNSRGLIQRATDHPLVSASVTID